MIDNYFSKPYKIIIIPILMFNGEDSIISDNHDIEDLNEVIELLEKSLKYCRSDNSYIGESCYLYVNIKNKKFGLGGEERYNHIVNNLLYSINSKFMITDFYDFYISLQHLKKITEPKNQRQKSPKVRDTN